MTAFKKWQNEGLMPRYSLDQWDRVRLPFRFFPVAIANPSYSKVRCAERYETKELHTNVYMAVMDRDRRLTGTFRGQTDNPVAPPGFEFSNGWKVSKRRQVLFESYGHTNYLNSWRSASRKRRVSFDRRTRIDGSGGDGKPLYIYNNQPSIAACCTIKRI